MPKPAKPPSAPHSGAIPWNRHHGTMVILLGAGDYWVTPGGGGGGAVGALASPADQPTHIRKIFLGEIHSRGLYKNFFLASDPPTTSPGEAVCHTRKFHKQ